MSAIVCRATAYRRRRSKAIGRPHRKLVLAWYCLVAASALFLLNVAYQILRKPGELFAPVSAALSKSPESTWQSYAPLFDRYSTTIISPELLAALAQVEGNGNPIAHTYWRWQWSWHPGDIYRPASSALGMYQMTDGTFAEARRFCIRDHQVLTSCWSSRFYVRTIPSDSIEMTSAYLHRGVVNTLGDRFAKVSLAQKQTLAAVIHLCGLTSGEHFLRRGFRVTAGQSCGTHNLRGYLYQVNLMKERFHKLRRSAVL
jgi:hypothetical protein